MKSIVVVLAFTLCCMIVPMTSVSADELKYEMKPAATVKDVLGENAGKRVILRLQNGESLEGTVMKLGDGLVHIAKLSGKDFYDATVRIDAISAVIFKVRGN
jgi:hypothetical protein